MIPLAQQQAKLARLLDEREAHYRRGLNKGTLSADDAQHKWNELQAIRRTFAWLIANHDWIKTEANRRKLHAQNMADIEQLEAQQAARVEDAKQHPAVAAVLDAFPDAQVMSVKSTAPGGRLDEGESPGATQQEDLLL